MHELVNDTDLARIVLSGCSYGRQIEINWRPLELVSYALYAQRHWGVPASITLAQFALESGYGRYLAGAYNPFGIKCHAMSGRGCTERSTREFVHGRWVLEYARFQNYSSFREAFIDHAQICREMVLSRDPRFDVTQVWAVWLSRICAVYATDPHYADKIGHIIRDFSLQDIDVKIDMIPALL